MSPWYEIDSHAVTAHLGTEPDKGLAASEAARRLIADGPNELIEPTINRSKPSHRHWSPAPWPLMAS